MLYMKQFYKKVFSQKYFERERRATREKRAAAHHIKNRLFFKNFRAEQQHFFLYQAIEINNWNARRRY